MTKPWEEKWIYEPGAIMRDEGDHCSHFIYSPYLEESLDSDTLRLMSAAPDMARVLLAIWNASTDNPDLRDHLADALRAGGVADGPDPSTAIYDALEKAGVR